jgi:hypothetical protein
MGRAKPMAKIDYDKINSDLSEMKYMSVILEDYLNDLWRMKADAEMRATLKLPDIKQSGISLYIIDDQTPEVVMFAALKLGDMIREAIDKYEALLKDDAPNLGAPDCKTETESSI